MCPPERATPEVLKRPSAGGRRSALRAAFDRADARAYPSTRWAWAVRLSYASTQPALGRPVDGSTAGSNIEPCACGSAWSRASRLAVVEAQGPAAAAAVALAAVAAASGSLGAAAAARRRVPRILPRRAGRIARPFMRRRAAATQLQSQTHIAAMANCVSLSTVVARVRRSAGHARDLPSPTRTRASATQVPTEELAIASASMVSTTRALMVESSLGDESQVVRRAP